MNPSSSSASATSCSALNNGPWRSLPERAAADFQAGSVGPFLEEKLAAGSAAQVSQAWTAFGSATASCRSFTATTASGLARYELQSLSFPSYGDQTYAFAITVSLKGMSAAGDIVVRKGTTLVQLVALGVGTVPVATVEQATSAAVARAK